jgi:hypothetical protein
VIPGPKECGPLSYKFTPGIGMTVPPGSEETGIAETELTIRAIIITINNIFPYNILFIFLKPPLSAINWIWLSNLEDD